MSATKAILAVLALAAPAAAQPDANVRSTCEVRFVRAPDDVRHVIESWLAAEPRCNSTIDLRVIPTDQGYYLLAQRPDGRIHERYVPDSQSAGVLVASWVADDWVGQTDVWSAPRPGAPPVALTSPSYQTPSETAVTAVVAPARRPARARTNRWLTLGPMFSAKDSHDGGLRAEVDMMTIGPILLGLSLAWTETAMTIQSTEGPGSARFDDFGATVYAAYTVQRDRWELRAAAGIGGVYTEMHGELDPGWSLMGLVYGTGGGVTATGSVLATRRLGDNWGVQAGLYGHVVQTSFPTNNEAELRRADAQLFLFTGLRLRL